MFIPIVIGALGAVTKGFLKGQEDLEIKGRVETIQSENHQLKLMWKNLNKHTGIFSDEKTNKTEDKSVNATLRDNQKILVKEERLKRYRDRLKQCK